jgi:hypothetical protein
MLTYLLVLIGLALLCGGWALFQLWLGKRDPDKAGGYQPGCGACSQRDCPKHQDPVA